MRCDAQSRSVAATGGVLVRATGAQEKDRSGGQQALPGAFTHGDRERFLGATLSPPPILPSDGIHGSIHGSA